MKSLNLKTGGKVAIAAGIVASIFLITFIRSRFSRSVR